MKTLAILLASLSLTTACATDEDTLGGRAGLRPAFKPEVADRILVEGKVGDDSADIDEGVSDIVPEWSDRGRDRLENGFFVPEWAEEVKISGKTLTLLHAASGETLLVSDDE